MDFSLDADPCLDYRDAHPCLDWLQWLMSLALIKILFTARASAASCLNPSQTRFHRAGSQSTGPGQCQPQLLPFPGDLEQAGVGQAGTAQQAALAMPRWRAVF